MPFYQNNKQIIEAQDKLVTLESKYQISKT